ncbi:MAG: hypothetical protein HRT45_18345 [Bdellovibrionales bacterium]|nr:hypothetical protein [Bdellovibrionales bacterium]
MNYRKLLDVAKEQNRKTPFYIFDQEQFEKNAKLFVKTWRETFSNLDIAYSVKTNKNPRVIEVLNQVGFLPEVCSPFELEAIMQVSKPSRVYADGPAKEVEDLRVFMQRGAHIQADSLDEVERLIGLVESGEFSKEQVKLNLRLAVNHKGAFISRLGLSEAELDMALDVLAQANVKPAGVHIHFGKNITSVDDIRGELARLQPQILKVKSLQKAEFVLNLGGGFASPSVWSSRDLKMSDYVRDLKVLIESLGVYDGSTRLVIEPGRCLTEDFASLVTKITCVKSRDYTNRLAILNTGTNSIRSVMAGAHNVVYLPYDYKVEGPIADCALFGANCYEADIFRSEVQIPDTAESGDYIIFERCGSYDLETANSWTREVPPVYFRDSDDQLG